MGRLKVGVEAVILSGAQIMELLDKIDKGNLNVRIGPA
jgi:hypothetical protein